jgi:hypothetical protein
MEVGQERPADIDVDLPGRRMMSAICDNVGRLHKAFGFFSSVDLIISFTPPQSAATPATSIPVAQ